MPSLKDIRNRIASVKNTQKITKAMKMVAAAKLRQAQEAVVASRPYADKLVDMIDHLADRVDRERHALLRRPEFPSRAALLVVAADRGLCGAYNSNVLKTSFKFHEERLADREDIDLRLIGRKANDFYKRRDPTVSAYLEDAWGREPRAVAQELADDYCELFEEKEIDELYVVYTKFRSVISQDVVIDRVLPLRGVDDDGTGEEEGEPETLVEYIYEPSPAEILDTILPLAVAIQIQRALLESAASEQGARMTAMDNATNNAGEMIESLTLEYNRARQAAITKELIEIVSGAEAV